MTDPKETLPRREVIGLTVAAALLASGGRRAEARPLHAPSPDPEEFCTPQPIPVQHPAHEGFVEVPGARLFYWDTGGRGVPVLLAHPGTGSALIWGYQQPALAAAGYRVVAWSRRGHARTEVLDGGTGAANDDIDRLADALKLRRFHALGSAAGGGVMLDYAVARPARLRTLTIACSIGNVVDPAYRKRSAALRPAPFDKLPPDVRELGPCYRAANPEGVAQWLALEAQARTAPAGPPPSSGPVEAPGTRWQDVSALPMPILWMTGDADLFTPPPLLREFHLRTPGSEIAVINGAGHSAYWEQPRAFNATVLDFLRRRGR